MPLQLDARTIIFVENREKTLFWAGVAKVLEERGFRIHWIVQNHQFASGLPGTVHRIAYPRQNGVAGDNWRLRYPVLLTDRGREYFAAGSGHYDHYADAIKRVLRRVRPCLVVGESTLFHELIAVSLCDEFGIPFVHPAAERYPQDRFVMFSGLSQTAYVDGPDMVSKADAQAIADRVRAGRERPAYMRKPDGIAKIAKRVHWAWTRGKVWQARLQGERFNTPSLARKWQLSRWASRNRGHWSQLQRNVPDGSRAIMYPMHVAPEANIDVWGRPYSDQTALIRRLVEACPANMVIAVKANPSPKYEITDDLIALARTEPRLVLLPLAIPMADAMRQCMGAITVSGTIAFEAIFGSGRCLALRHPVIDQSCPHLSAASPEAAVAKYLRDPDCGRGSDEASVALLQAITRRSFKGFVSDPFSAPSCMDAANLRNVAAGIAATADKACQRAPVLVESAA